ncbi:hypothetical protein K1719_000220 [Acacia pycnantha]|nr:hypothetical protein K1719_000220 [Acacia pycnantha]
MFRKLFSTSVAQSNLHHRHLLPIPLTNLQKPFTAANFIPNLVTESRFVARFQDITPFPRFSSSYSGMGDSRRPLSVPIPAVDKADKSELLRALETSLETREAREGLHFVVTATSRAKRPGEVDGKDYFFVSKEEFQSMVERNELLEYALVYGDYKGIPKQQIREFMGKGYDIVLRVDVQGAQTLRKILGNSAVFIFVVAESEMAMVERLVDRKTETVESLIVRIATAREEVKHLKNFDYVVVNAKGKLENSVTLVSSIIDAEKAKVWQRSAVV